MPRLNSPSVMDVEPREPSTGAPSISPRPEEANILRPTTRPPPPPLRCRFPIMSKLFVFRPIDNSRDRSATCIGCQRVYNHSKNDRLTQHAIECELIDQEDKDNLAAQMEEYKKNEDIKKKQEAVILEKVKQEKIDIALTSLVAVQMLPLRIVDSYEFRHYTELLNRMYRMPTRRNLTNQLLPFHSNRVTRFAIEKLSQSAEFSLTLEIDG